MHFPAESLLSKAALSVERNYKDIDPKDTALLLWSFGRINYHSY
jgi:hypothetical protein